MRAFAFLATSANALGSIARRPALVRLIAAMFLRWTGSSLALVGYLVVAYDAGGPAGVALLGVMRMVPAAALAPLAGTLSRVVGHGRLLIATHLVRAASAGLAATALALGWPVALVFIGAALSGTAGAIVRPLHAAALPELAGAPSELVAANVASSTGEGLAGLLGPALGGLLLAVGGPAAAVAAAAMLSLACAVLVALAHRPVAETSDQAIGRVRTGGSSALDFLRRRSDASVVIVGFGFQTLVRGLLTTLVVAASIELLGLGTPGVGALNAALGAGGLFGAVASIGLAGRSRLAPTFVVALALWGAPIALVGVWPVAAVALILLAIVGVNNAALDVAGYTLLQRTVPPSARVAVLGLLEGVIGVGVAIGAVLAPVLIALFGLRGALIATGIVLPVVALVTWPRLRAIDAAATVPVLELEALRQIALFAPLPLTTLEDLAHSAVPARFAPGDMLMTEGEAGDRFLVLTAGSVEVLQRGRRVRICGPGDGIGEIALLRRTRRTASVRALEPTEAYALGPDAFISAVTGHAVVSAAADTLIEERLVATPD